MRLLNIIQEFPSSYEEVWKYQKILLEDAIKNKNSYLIITEHHPIITIGRSYKGGEFVMKKEVLQREGVKIVEVERGGKLTYHGPGQLVVYPIINLSIVKKDIPFFIHNLENTIIETLKHWGIYATTYKEYPGVWVNDKKIAAVGVAIKKWTTYHGVSLNVNLEKDFSIYIIPCGIKYKKITSMNWELSSWIKREEVVELLIDNFCKIFDFGGKKYVSRSKSP